MAQALHPQPDVRSAAGWILQRSQVCGAGRSDGGGVRTGRRATHPWGFSLCSPKTKWRPALPPASTVPRSVRLARRPGLLSQGGSGRGLAAPVGPSGSFAGILLFRFRFLRVPRPASRPASVPWRVPSFSALRLRIQVPCRTPMKRSFFGVLSRNLPPGGFRFRRTLEGKWVRLWLAPLPRASSFRLPGTSLPSASVLANFRRFPRGRA